MACGHMGAGLIRRGPRPTHWVALFSAQGILDCSRAEEAGVGIVPVALVPCSFPCTVDLTWSVVSSRCCCGLPWWTITYSWETNKPFPTQAAYFIIATGQKRSENKTCEIGLHKKHKFNSVKYEKMNYTPV